LAGFDDYPNAQVYCTATKMKQARIVWKQAKKFIEIEPDLKELFNIKDHDAIIESIDTGGEIMALGRDTGTIDGFDPHGGIIDEYHAHPTNQMLKQLEDGSVNQLESLISIITTAGFNLNGPCYKEYEYCCNVLEGIFKLIKTICDVEFAILLYHQALIFIDELMNNITPKLRCRLVLIWFNV
jgi:phage terminase large subunit-like protein